MGMIRKPRCCNPAGTEPPALFGSRDAPTTAITLDADSWAATGIHQQRAGLHLCEERAVHELLRLGREGQQVDHDVRVREQTRQRDCRLGTFARMPRDTDHARAEWREPRGHRASDRTVADDDDALTLEVADAISEVPLPFGAVLEVDELRQPPLHGEDRGHHPLRNRDVVHAVCIAQHDPRRHRGQNRVHAGAERLDQPEAGQLSEEPRQVVPELRSEQNDFHVRSRLRDELDAVSERLHLAPEGYVRNEDFQARTSPPGAARRPPRIAGRLAQAARSADARSSSANFSTSSTRLARWNVISLRTLSGTSSMSFSLRFGRMTSLSPIR